MKISINKQELENLQQVCIEAVQYVGSANYQERENNAIANVNRAFVELKEKLAVRPFTEYQAILGE